MPLWRLFPFGADTAFLIACGVLPLAYALRDHRSGAAFTARQRAMHVACIVAVFVVVPTIASIVLRETGKPYTYIHDGALMIEWAARKLLLGQNPYVADYLDTPLYYWPMVNNPALYHLTYFPFLFLATPAIFLITEARLPAKRRARARRALELAGAQLGAQRRAQREIARAERDVAAAPAPVASPAPEGSASTADLPLEPAPAPAGAVD